MSFILEVSKNGKDCILFNNYKYRESYAVKNGDIVWRCLGKNCRASVKTDSGKTAIFSSNETHNGSHPVTMRAFTSTPPRRRSPSTTAPSSVLSLNSTTTMSVPTNSQELDVTPTVEQHRSVQVTPLANTDVLQENMTLKEELLKLRGEYRVILDHSIDSDQRLLEYTEDIFLPPLLKTNPSPQPPYVSIGTQTEHDFNHLHVESTVTSQDNLVLENNKLVNSSKVLNEKVKKLKIALLSLQKEKKCLENEISLKERKITTLSKHIELLCSNKVNINQLNSKYVSEMTRAQSLTWDSSKWLDDTIIQSYYDAFSSLGNTSKTKCLFIGPSITQLLKHGSPDVIINSLNDLSFNKADFAFCCVNNSNNPEKDDSGSHWSLLVIDNADQKAYHFDTASTLNLKSAQKVVENLGFNLDSFVEVPCVQQSNNFECGLNVLITSKIILFGYCLNESRALTNLYEWYNLFFKSSITVLPSDNVIDPVDNDSISRFPVSKPVKKPFPKCDKIQKTQKECSWKLVKTKLKNKLKTDNSQDPTCWLSRNKFSILAVNEKERNNISENQCSNTQYKPKVPKGQYYSLKKTLKAKDVTNNSVDSRPKVVILSDSHGRGISKLLQEDSNGTLHVSSWVKPNARLGDVLKGASTKIVNLQKADSLVIIGGTNNFVNGQCSGALDELDTLLRTRVVPRVVVVGLPQRHDTPSMAPAIHDTNNLMHSLTSSFENATFLPLNSLNRSCYTQHGMHLNLKGKMQLSSLIYNIILSRYPNPSCQSLVSCNLEQSIYPIPVNPSPHQTQRETPQTNSSKHNHHRIHPQSRVFYNKSFLETRHKQYEVPWTAWTEIVGSRTVWARTV